MCQSCKQANDHGSGKGIGKVAVDTALFLEQLGNTVARACKVYRRFIENGRAQGHEERYYRVVDQRFLGDENFVRQMAEQAPQKEIRPAAAKIRFERLLRAVA